MAIHMTRYPNEDPTPSGIRKRFRPINPRGQTTFQVYGNAIPLAIYIAEHKHPVEATTGWSKYSVDFPANGGVQNLPVSPGFDYQLGGASDRLIDPGDDTVGKWAEHTIQGPAYVK